VRVLGSGSHGAERPSHIVERGCDVKAAIEQVLEVKV